jgi:hypothetical protein
VATLLGGSGLADPPASSALLVLGASVALVLSRAPRPR